MSSESIPILIGWTTSLPDNYSASQAVPEDNQRFSDRFHLNCLVKSMQLITVTFDNSSFLASFTSLSIIMCEGLAYCNDGYRWQRHCTVGTLAAESGVTVPYFQGRLFIG